jgi:tRNA modification GTPase
MLTRPAPLEPRLATFTRIAGDAADEVVATSFPSPHSYTGDDIVEISAHGNPLVLAEIVRLACREGARLARPGEFTLRAYLNGKRDLVQAEAVGDLIAAVTPLQARIAFDQLQGTLTAQIAAIDAPLFDLIARLEASLDFPDEGYHFVEQKKAAEELDAIVRDIDRLLADSRKGRMIREGAQVVIAGRVNVGKSSIFNCLQGSERAIVTAVAGTTRDLLTESVDVGGVPVCLIDTAGDRPSTDVVEEEGIRRAAHARTVADLILLVIDSSQPLCEEDLRLLTETGQQPR